MHKRPPTNQACHDKHHTNCDHHHDHDHDHHHGHPGHVHDEHCQHGHSQPYVRASPKVGRNDPCPCQSGKKFKKCCGQ
jgi:uncharacterized protein YchJ